MLDACTKMPKNPLVYLDVSIGSRTGGRVTFELFADITPRTAENFRGLCTGEYGIGKNTKKRLSYEGCSIFRSVKGMMIQSGDFQFNNGDGGESVYGGTFNDEDFTRRHTQAGVLSMANKGRNSNGSQFFITLKRCPQLDGKHIAFGQVVEGMDVIRAISQVPTDLDSRPRVAITIVGSGEVDRKRKNQADPHLTLEKQIADLNEDAVPTSKSVNEAVKGRAILAGKQGGAPSSSAAVAPSTSMEDSLEAETGLAPARNERERKLFELRLRMNQGRAQNNKEVIEEQKRAADPDYARKKAEERFKKASDKEEGKDSGEAGGRPKLGDLSKEKQHLQDTEESCELREAKKRKKNKDAFGWDVFNQDSIARAHEKRVQHLSLDESAYNEQKARLAEDTSLFAGHGYQATDDQKDRLAEAITKMSENKKDFSRRRDHIVDEDCTYVNERNRLFNKKMQRYFGAYTEEIRQNLERGTAL